MENHSVAQQKGCLFSQFHTMPLKRAVSLLLIQFVWTGLHFLTASLWPQWPPSLQHAYIIKSIPHSTHLNTEDEDSTFLWNISYLPTSLHSTTPEKSMIWTLTPVYQIWRFISMVTGLYHEPGESSAQTTYFFTVHFNIIIPSAPNYPKLYILFRFSNQNLYAHLIFIKHVTCSACTILLGYTIITVVCEDRHIVKPQFYIFSRNGLKCKKKIKCKTIRQILLGL
jgi:hypothetical protein